MTTEKARAATWYADELGWPVLPLHNIENGACTCKRAECGSPGKHPRSPHGLKDASTEAGQITSWWGRWPEANVGVVTGATAGIVAIDVDTRHGGDNSLAELVRVHGELPATVEALTGGGGRHLVFKHPGGTVRNRSNLRPGIDVRGDGGYVVAPPSDQATGGSYHWREGRAPFDIRPAELPTWLHALVVSPARHLQTEPAVPGGNGAEAARLLAAASRYAERAAPAAEGERNTAAFNLAGHLLAFRAGALRLTTPQVLALVRQWNARNAPPLPEDELSRAVESAARNGTPRAPHEVRPAPREPHEAPHAGGSPVVVRFAEIEPRDVSWLWHHRIPLGRITLLVGRPGEGKSYLSVDMAARVSTGRPWPDGAPCGCGDALFITGEDDPHDTIRPRLDAAGANAERVHLLRTVRRNERGENREVPFTLADVGVLEQALRGLPNCRLIIIDPIGSFLGGATDAHRDNEVRAVLAPVAAIAERHGAAVLVVAHRRKAAGTVADDLALGSRAFTGIARAVWHLARDPQDKLKRLLLAGKANLAAEQDGLAFRIRGEPPAIVWEPGRVSVTANEILAAENGAQRPGPEPEARLAAVAWLRERLAAGPVDAALIKTEAREGGFGWRTIHRAADTLRVRRWKNRFAGGWLWALCDLAPKVPSSPTKDDYLGILAPSAGAIKNRVLESQVPHSSSEDAKMPSSKEELGIFGDPPLDVVFECHEIDDPGPLAAAHPGEALFDLSDPSRHRR